MSPKQDALHQKEGSESGNASGRGALASQLHQWYFEELPTMDSWRLYATEYDKQEYLNILIFHWKPDALANALARPISPAMVNIYHLSNNFGK